MFYEKWTTSLATGFPWINELHDRLALLLRQASAVSDRDFCPAFRRLIAQVEALSREEEDRMGQWDLAYQRACIEQRAHLLQGLHCAHARILEGDIALGRRIVNELLPALLGPRCNLEMPATPERLDRGGPCLNYS